MGDWKIRVAPRERGEIESEVEKEGWLSWEEGEKRSEIGYNSRIRNDSFCSQQTRDDEVHFIPVMDRVFNFFSPGLMYIDSKFLFFSFYFPSSPSSTPDIDDVTREHS